MTFVLPPTLAQQFSISLKTVYNYINKHQDKIRTKKEFWKRVVNLEDFTTVLQKQYEVSYPIWNNVNQKEASEEKKNDWNDFETIQKENKEITEENMNLKKYNANLEDQVWKYGLLLTQEKAEKKEILNKYEGLQNQYNEKVEELGNEKVKATKRYYSLLILCFIILIILVTIVIPNVIDYFF